jgi:hypothetical protein
MRVKQSNLDTIYYPNGDSKTVFYSLTRFIQMKPFIGITKQGQNIQQNQMDLNYWSLILDK